MSGPLAGYRIIDMTSIVMGPFATQILGDNGADIIKVEAPEGDVMREVQPSRNPGMGTFLLNANRNKRSIVLDLKKPQAREALKKLIAGADALVSTIRPAAMARLGLGYEDCQGLNPKLVYLSAHGYSEAGPYAGKPAYDDVIQGLCGMAAVQAGADGAPRFVASPIIDKIVAVHIVYALTMALLHRERTGEGQHVEVPMFETMVSFQLLEHAAGMVFEPPLGPPGYVRVLSPHRRPYATQDGYVCVLPYTTRQWQRFFELAGRPEMVDDERVTDRARRSEAVGELYAMVADAVAEWPTDALLEALEAADIPAGRVNALEDVPSDPHLSGINFFRQHDHPSEGKIVLSEVPITFGRSPGGIDRLAPRLGEHSVELLREVGFDEDAIGAMVADGAVVDGAEGGLSRVRDQVV